MAIVRVSKSTHLSTSSDEVWAFVSDFGGYASWQPHIESVEMQPNGDRKVNFTRGDSILDRIAVKDAATKTLTYELVPGQQVPMKSLAATFVVTGDGDGCEVAYTIAVDGPDEMQELARVAIGADVDGALAGLTSRFDG